MRRVLCLLVAALVLAPPAEAHRHRPQLTIRRGEVAIQRATHGTLSGCERASAVRIECMVTAPAGALGLGVWEAEPAQAEDTESWLYRATLQRGHIQVAPWGTRA